MSDLRRYTVSNLPARSPEGRIVYASNGRKPGEAYGQGTGVPVFFCAGGWLRVCDCESVVEPPSPPSVQSDRLLPGQSLGVGQSIQSGDGRYVLVLQGDGNVVTYEDAAALWNSGTYNHPEAYALIMRTDGIVDLVDGYGISLWSAPNDKSKTVPGSWLVLQTDNNLVLYTQENRPVWSTLTGDL